MGVSHASASFTPILFHYDALPYLPTLLVKHKVIRVISSGSTDISQGQEVLGNRFAAESIIINFHHRICTASSQLHKTILDRVRAIVSPLRQPI
jgi:hypothetical protein